MNAEKNGAGNEPIAGTNLTTVTEYTETAIALADLKHRFQNLVVDVSTPKGLKEAKSNVSELRSLRTGLEAKRKDLKAPLLEQGKLLDDEAKRITAEISALEEPLAIQVKAEETRIQHEELQRLEALRLRNEAILARIQGFRDLPATVAGKPAIIISGQLTKLQETELVEEDFGEHYQTALDARDAVIGRLSTMLSAQKEHEAEQARVKADRERLEQLEREAEARRKEDDVRAERDRAEADRLAQVERDRVAAEEAAARATEQAEQDRLAAIERGKQMAEAAAERDRLAAERAEQEASLQAQRDAQAAEQARLDAEAAKLKRERAEAAKRIEADRLASLGLREAAQAVVNAYQMDEGNERDAIMDRLVSDLSAALANDAAQAKPARAKRSAAA
ncbi:MAG: hypothetical protein ACREPQ_09805 [Rhodanobacter sp.]